MLEIFVEPKDTGKIKIEFSEVVEDLKNFQKVLDLVDEHTGAQTFPYLFHQY